MEHLSQDARRKLGDRQAAERRQKRRGREQARRASGTGPPDNPRIEPMKSIAARQHQELRNTTREQIRAPKRQQD